MRNWISRLSAAAFLAAAEFANAAGLDKAKAAGQQFTSDWLSFVPIIATLSLMVMAVLWWLRVVRASTFGMIAVALLIIGSANELVGVFL